MSPANGATEDAAARGLPFRKADRALREAFLEEIAAGNLLRMCWVIAFYFPISLWVFLSFLQEPDMESIFGWALFDLLLAGVFFSCAFLWRRRPGLRVARRWLVRAYCVYCLVSMTGYYFSLVERFGDNASFVLGVLLVAVLFRLPPVEFILLLLANQAVFVGGVLLLHRGGDFQASALIFGLDALVLGLLAAWTLFGNDWRAFQQKRTLERMNRELRQQAQEQDELMAITAHDLASPLDSVTMLLGVLLETPRWKAKADYPALEGCRQTLVSMQALVGSLLEAHSAEREGPACGLVAIDARVCIAAALGRVAPTAKSKGISLSCELPAALPPVLGDPASLEQALENLLYNGVKFSQPGTNVEVRALESGEQVFVEVLDEGPGIAEEDRANLFRKFFKTRNRPTHGERSFGIGLLVVRQLMEKQEGAVAHLPRTPGGSIFRLVLGKAAPAEAE